MIEQETLKERIDNIGITHKKISQFNWYSSNYYFSTNNF